MMQYRDILTILQGFRNSSPEVIQMNWCIFIGFGCLMPLFFAANNASEYKGSELRKAISSQRNRDSAITAIALAVPIFLGLITEKIISVFVQNNEQSDKFRAKYSLLNRTERFAIACGLMTIPITAFLPNDIRNLVNIYLCLRRCRYVLIGGAITISLYRLDKNVFTRLKTCFIIVLVAIGSVSGCYAENFCNLRSNNYILIRELGALCYLLASTTTIYCIANWLYVVAKSKMKGSTASEDYYDRDLKATLPILYTAATGTAILLIATTNRANPETDRYTASSLFYNHMGLILFLIFLLSLSDRAMKYEIIRGLYELNESKKVYVRYISRELRTPLNSVYLGLQLLCDDLQANVCDEYQRPCETMMEVQSACRTAVETLNDLLCFDKLESGILKLHKHEVPVVPFLDNCVRMLGTQAMEAQVTITNTSSIGTITDDDMITPQWDKDDLSPYHTPLLLHSDVITMDKFKMDQVVRNLISNALKYTPRGGSVTVCASFVPDIENDKLFFNDSARGSRVLYPFLPDSSSSFWKMRPCSALLQYFLSYRKHSQIHMTDGYPNDLESGGVTSHIDPKIAPSDGSHTTVDIGAAQDTPDSRMMGDDTVDPLTDSQNAVDKAFTDSVPGKLRIIVADTGIGLTESSQRLLFKVIDRLNPELLAGEGRGLGLYITSRIVRMHGGTIRVESGGLGKGCSFIVDINMHRMNTTCDVDVPVTRANSCASGATGPEGKVFTAAVNPTDKARRKKKTRDPVDSPSKEKTRGKVRNRKGGKSMDHRDPRVGPVLYSSAQRPSSIGFPIDSFREAQYSDTGEYYDVLVVDDSRLNRKLLCRLFRQAGYMCDEAEDGLSAVDKVKAKMVSVLSSEKQYDAILMDFVMPVMDGPTATQIIRSLGYTGPIFGVTGNALESDVDHFLSKGANAVLAKPFDFGHFRRLMKTVDIYPENEGEIGGL